MSRKSGILILAVVCVAAAAAILWVRPAQAAKPSPPLSLKAIFEEFLDVNGVNQYRFVNDIPEYPYVDTADVKQGKVVVKSGVEVKYYPSGSWDRIGRFKMAIDQSGFCQRFVRLDFKEPSTDPACDESGLPGFPVDPLFGQIGQLQTMTISITTQGVLVRRADGAIVQDYEQPINMDKMLTGDTKFIGLGITFTPTAPAFSDRSYSLGILVNPDKPHANIVCPDKDFWLFGTAELRCIEAGQVWEFRPHTQSFTNDPDNVVRLLHTNVQMDYLRCILLRAWRMPFVLRVWK